MGNPTCPLVGLADIESSDAAPLADSTALENLRMAGRRRQKRLIEFRFARPTTF